MASQVSQTTTHGAHAAIPRFRELTVSLPLTKLREELHLLDPHDWRTSYWGSPHGDVSFVLLRGGDSGNEQDFFCDGPAERPILDRLPTYRHLIGQDGPFGRVRFAFLFRMRPGGVTLAHQDAAGTWATLHRVHVPIVTHPSAQLIVEGYAQHLSPDKCWTFDNQRLHGFVNGPTSRTHLILDVEPSPVLERLLAKAIARPGVRDAELASRTLDRTRARPSYPGDRQVRSWLVQAEQQGWTSEAMAQWLAQREVPTPHQDGHWDVELVTRLLSTGPR